jgi:hypothetical protein
MKIQSANLIHFLIFNILIIYISNINIIWFAIQYHADPGPQMGRGPWIGKHCSSSFFHQNILENIIVFLFLIFLKLSFTIIFLINSFLQTICLFIYPHSIIMTNLLLVLWYLDNIMIF